MSLLADQAQVKVAAQIFAQEFKQSGLFGQGGDLQSMQREMNDAIHGNIDAQNDAAEATEDFSDELEQSNTSLNSFRQVMSRGVTILQHTSL
jgi:hypothetical protein